MNIDIDNLVFMILQGVMNTFNTWNNIKFGGVSYLVLAFSFLIVSIIFTIVFAYIKSRLSNPYTIEKRNIK